MNEQVQEQQQSNEEEQESGSPGSRSRVNEILSQKILSDENLTKEILLT